MKNKTFTIISNNCVGGYIYQHFGLKYRTPTAGLFLEAEDFLKLCTDYKRYFSKEIQFIACEQSKNYEIFKDSDRWGEYPIGKIDDIEIYFMHYKSEEEAREKWYRRVSRINEKNVIFLYSENEGCSQNFVKRFMMLPSKDKICFTYNDYCVEGTTYSPRVSALPERAWRPRLVLSEINWKKYLNNTVVSRTGGE